MAEMTKIEWADHTFNPWIGCQRAGPGCDFCYAEAWDKRYRRKDARWGARADRTRTSPQNWNMPLKWQTKAEAFFNQHGRRQRVFCASLADVFDNHKSIPAEWRSDLADLVRQTPDLIWMFLTKRIGNATRMLIEMFPDGVPENLWIGATIVNQEEFDRDVPKLISTPAGKRFLSMEPLLGPVELHAHIREIDWIILGGESGPDARPMNIKWAIPIRDQCLAFGVPFLFKQWGEWFPYGEIDARGFQNSRTMGEKPGTFHEWPTGNFSVRIGKKQAGRFLAGRTWDQVPEDLERAA